MTASMIDCESSAPALRSALFDSLRAFNESKTGPSGLAPLGVALQDETGAIIGGACGRSIYQWLFVEFLFVPEQLRGQGWGTRLMGRCEEIAKLRGCIGICLDTFNFQAPDFYRKLGFDVFETLESPDFGVTRYFMRKRL